MTPHTLSDHAVILSSRPSREADRLLSLLTREHGRLNAFARNIRSSRRRYASPAQTGECCHVTIWMPRDISLPGKVLRIEPRFPHTPPRPSVGHHLAIHYALALVDETLPPSDPHPRLFDDLCVLLPELGQAPTPRRRTLLRAFEIRLLDRLGIAPSPGVCGHCGRPLASSPPSLALDGFLCSSCSPASLPVLHPSFLDFYNLSLSSLPPDSAIPPDLDRQLLVFFQNRLRSYLGRMPSVFSLKNRLRPCERPS